MTKSILHDCAFGEDHCEPSEEISDIRHLLIDDEDPDLIAANGVHIVAKRLVREQTRRGRNARLIYLCQPGQEGFDDPNDVPITRIPMHGRKVFGHRISLDREVLMALLSGYDRHTLFHIHGGRRPLLMFITRELRRRGIQYAITIHGRYSHIFDEKLETKNRLSALYLRAAEKRLLETAAFVQAITPLEYSIVEQLAPRARIELIPNAAYSSATDLIPAAPSRMSPSAEFPTFGFCGRFAVEHKGIDLLLEGFAQYRRAGGKGRLVLVGTGPLRSSLQALINELDLGDTVELHGPLFGDEKQRMIKSWDFFAMPSRFDVLPTAALEAALLGTPLITSTATGFKPYLDRFNGGFSIGTLSAEAVAEALQQASRLSPQEWSLMSHNAYKMALAVGDWSDISANLEDLYLKHAAAA